MEAELSVERVIRSESDAYDEIRHRYEIFTVNIGEHKRILTVFANSSSIMTKWVSEVKKTYRNTKEPVIVGLCVERDISYEKNGVSENPYETMTLCIGSNCLIYNLPSGFSYTRGYRSNDVPKALKEFLSDSKFVFVGMDMKIVSKKLEKDQNLKIAKPVDIRSITQKVCDIGNRFYDPKFSLYEITKMLLEKRMDVVRPLKIPFWPDREDKRFDINRKYAMFLTVDAFFSHEIGVKYADLFLSKSISASKFL